MADIRLYGATSKEDLNPDLWRTSGVGLKDNIRNALLRICDEFHKYIGIEKPYDDAVITGESASYMWNKNSPIRLYLVIETPDDPWVQSLLHAKKEMFSSKYEFDIVGYDVSVNVSGSLQDIPYSGVFSLKDQSWNRKPTRPESEINRDKIIKQVQYYMNLIERIMNMQDPKAKQTAGMKLIKKLHTMRDKREVSDFDEDYLVFKSLQGSGEINELIDDLIAVYSEKYSIQEGIYKPSAIKIL